MPDDVIDAHRNGVEKALAEGWRVLERGGKALDAVQTAIISLENDETFDAGRGSFLNRDGKVQLDALIMDGATLRAGAIFPSKLGAMLIRTRGRMDRLLDEAPWPGQLPLGPDRWLRRMSEIRPRPRRTQCSRRNEGHMEAHTWGRMGDGRINAWNERMGTHG